MSWETDLLALFDDLEQQAEALYDADREVELADRSRAAYHEVTLASRLMASVGDELTLDVRGVGAVTGRLDRVGRGWCLVHGWAQEWVVPEPAISAVRGASGRSFPEAAWPVVARLGLASVLRHLAEGQSPCVVHLLDGTRHEVTLRRVGADFVEAELPGHPERPDRTVLLAFGALAAVQSRD